MPLSPRAALTVAAALAALCWPAPSDAAQKPYRAVNLALLEQEVAPRYAALAGAASALDAAAAQFCAAPDAASLEPLEGAYHETVDAWQGVQHITFGPVSRLKRGYRMQFWPDTGNRIGQALDTLLARLDAALLEPEAFAETSVAIQGLPALELLLFGEAEEASGMMARLQAMVFGGAANHSLLQADADAARRCRVLGAIAANLETMTGGIHREWTAGAQPYLERLARPGEHDPSFKSDKEVTSAIFETLRLGLRRVAELKLGLPLGLPRKKPKPERAESWRSSRSIRNIVVNLRALEALYFGPQSLGLAGLVEDEALDDLIRRAFAQTIATARSIEPPLAAALSNSGEHGEIEQLHKEVTALARIVETRLPSELDIILGFNAADGD